MMVFEILKTGNFQARVLKDMHISGINKGADVNLQLTHNDYVLVSDIDGNPIDALNLDTHADYDKYFKIY